MEGGEYWSDETDEYLKEKGIVHESTLPYTPQEDGVSERKNRTLNDKVRSSLYDSAQGLMRNDSLPNWLWESAVRHACWVENRTPSRALANGITPYEAYYGRKPNVGMLKVFACEAWAHIPTKFRTSKYSPRSVKGFHIGYATNMKAYQVYDPVSRRVITSRDVKFDEGDGDSERIVIVVREDDEEEDVVPVEGGRDGMVVEGDGKEDEDVGGAAEAVGDSGGDSGEQYDEDDVPSKQNPTSTSLNTQPDQPRRSTRSRFAPIPDDDNRFNITSRNPTGAANVADVPSVGDEHAMAAWDPDYREKMSSAEAPLWQEAMNVEMATQRQMGTYEEVLPPPDVNIVGLSLGVRRENVVRTAK